MSDEGYALSREDIQGYLKVKEENSLAEVVVELEHGDFTQMPFKYLTEMIRFLVDCGNIQKDGENQDNAIQMTVEEVKARLGEDVYAERIYNLLRVYSGRAGFLVARLVQDKRELISVRTADRSLHDIHAVIKVFYEGSLNQFTMQARADAEFVKRFIHHMKRIGEMEEGYSFLEQMGLR